MWLPRFPDPIDTLVVSSITINICRTMFSGYHLSLEVNTIIFPFLIATMCVCMLSHFSHVQLFVTSWTVAHQALLSMGFSRQEYWSGMPFPSPGDLPNPGIKPMSLSSLQLAGRFFTTVSPGKLLQANKPKSYFLFLKQPV